VAASAIAALSLSLLSVPATTAATAAEPVIAQAPPVVINSADVQRAESNTSRGATRTERTTVGSAARPVAVRAERKTRPVAKRATPPAAKPATTRKASAKPAAKRRTHVATRRTINRPGVRSSSARAAGRAAVVIGYARQQLGKPYVFGVLDCSGLTKRSFARVGIGLPHKASRQDERGYRVSRSAARAGDLVFWGGDSAYHVGIYLGRGRVIHAPRPGARVRIADLWGSPYFVRVLR
jgi:cell wall-associated NlpC family hydrolase